MRGIADLTRLLEEWRRLTESEGQAILGDNWNGVAECQARKARLQGEVTGVLQIMRATISGPENSPPAPQSQFDSRVRELMGLENRNRDLLAARRAARQVESQRLTRATRDLQRVRGAYGMDRRPCWQAYS